MNKYAIIVAGGTGSRMGTPVPKQFLLLQGKPVVWYTIKAFLQAFPEINLVVVLPPDHLEAGKEIVRSISAMHPIATIEGGNTRFHSVQNGLNHVPRNSVVFVHDGVRCLVTPELIRHCYETTLVVGSAVPAIAPVDTIRLETSEGLALLDRTKVKIIQTPQTFLSNILLKAYQQPFLDSFTDDASVVEHLGEKINLVEGDATNIKITRKIDLLIAEQILLERSR
jgi:2-C-methyl-D-erythritol 4-phosphate cytidylyltransferase